MQDLIEALLPLMDPQTKPWLTIVGVVAGFALLFLIETVAMATRAAIIWPIQTSGKLFARWKRDVYLRHDWSEQVYDDLQRLRWLGVMPGIVLGGLSTFSPGDVAWYLDRGLEAAPLDEPVFLAVNAALLVGVLSVCATTMRLVHLYGLVAVPLTGIMMVFFAVGFFCGFWGGGVILAVSLFNPSVLLVYLGAPFYAIADGVRLLTRPALLVRRSRRGLLLRTMDDLVASAEAEEKTA